MAMDLEGVGYIETCHGHGAAMATMEIFEFENGFCEVISEQLLADVSLQLAVLFVEKIEGSLTQFVGYSSFSVSSRAGANELGEIHSRLQ